MKRTLSAAIDDLPEEIRHEILSRLSFKPLFRCNCVSKLWNSVISDPKFRQFYLQRPLKSSSSSPRHLSAMLYPTVNFDRDLPVDSRDLSVHDIDDDAPPSLYITSFDRPCYTHHIDASSNGLVLSSLTPQQYPLYDSDEPKDEYEWYLELEFCVSNPLTSHSAKLNYWIYDSYEPWAYGLATRAPQPQAETQDSVTYKVVCIHVRQPPHTVDSVNTVILDIFSSDTGRWTRKEGMRFPDVGSYSARPRAFSYKGILHFFVWNTRTVVTYDPYDSPDQFGSIKFPSGSGGKKVMNSGLNVIRLGCEDMLEFGEIEDCGNGVWRLCVWRLVDYDKREWRLQKGCRISPLWKQSLLSDCKLLVAPHPLNTDFFCWFLANGKQLTVHDLASAEKLSADPFAVKEELVNTASNLASLVVPIALNPWSSPVHARRNSSSKPRYRKIIPSWFSSFTN